MSAEIYDAIEDNFADGSSLAAQFMIGAEVEMSHNFSVTFEYRRLSSLNLEFTGTDGVFREDFDYTSGAFLLGGKVSF
jgi:opacity protein-like surface antigen